LHPNCAKNPSFSSVSPDRYLVLIVFPFVEAAAERFMSIVFRRDRFDRWAKRRRAFRQSFAHRQNHSLDDFDRGDRSVSRFSDFRRALFAVRINTNFPRCSATFFRSSFTSSRFSSFSIRSIRALIWRRFYDLDDFGNRHRSRFAGHFGQSFRGLAMQADQPFQVGDVISIPTDARTGVVEGVSWRGVKIRTFQNKLLVISNSVLGKETIEVAPRDNLNARLVFFNTLYASSPATTAHVVREAVRQVENVSQKIRPIVRVIKVWAKAESIGK
jgi:hypothetical protein